MSNIGVSAFVRRRFFEKQVGFPSEDAFVSFLNEQFDEGNFNFIDTSEEFMKYAVVGNMTSKAVDHMEIDMSNVSYLRTSYDARQENELPVLVRYFSFPEYLKNQVKVADFLFLVLYSKEQLEKEGENPDELSDWNIVSIIGQDSTEPSPMQPITALRNALGVEEGGNGASLDKEKYMNSVEFWRNRAWIKYH